jgi:hypothetical protein
MSCGDHYYDSLIHDVDIACFFAGELRYLVYWCVFFFCTNLLCAFFPAAFHFPFFQAALLIAFWHFR